MMTQIQLQKLLQIIGYPVGSSKKYSNSSNLHNPVPDLPIFIDESSKGIDCILDGRKRLAHLILQAEAGLIPWNIQISVKFTNCSTKTKSSKMKENPNLLNSSYIQNFLINHAKPYYTGIKPLEEKPENNQKSKNDNKVFQLNPIPEEELIDLTRRIYRYLLNALQSNYKESYDFTVLVRDLKKYLNQSQISKILNRSESSISDAVSVGKLPEKYLLALKEGQISYSAAVILAKAKSPAEKDLLFKLAEILSVKSLANAYNYLNSHPNLIKKKDAFQKLKEIFTEKVKLVGGRARLRLHVGLERTTRKVFQNPTPQDLVFRLKITFHNRLNENFPRQSLEDIDKLRENIMKILSSSI